MERSDSGNAVLYLIEPSFHGAPYVRKALSHGVDVVVLRRRAGPPVPGGAPVPEIIVERLEPTTLIDTISSDWRERRSNTKCVGVLPGHEYCVVDAAHVAQALGFVGNSPDAAAICRDKGNMRRALSSHGINAPQSIVAYSVDEALEAATIIGYPVVGKPPDMAASWHVRMVDSESDLARHAELVLARTNMIQYPSAPYLLIEQYVSGPEFSVEMLLSNGEVRYASVTEKHKGPLPCFQETGHVVPASNVSGSARRALLEVATETVSAAGLRSGPCHVELILRDGVPYLVEIAARIAGGQIPELTILSGGPDLHDAAIFEAIGDSPLDIDLPHPCKGAAVQFVVGTPTGQTEDAVRRAAEIDGVVSARVEHDVDLLCPLPPRCAYVIAAAKTPEEALGIARTGADLVAETVRNT